MREDYSADGDAWSFFPHDHARSRAYRWSEDGLGGICDDRQTLCFALAFWNGRDPILKERIFGLTGPEGNHGEDAKEYWWYLDSTPTHSWMRWRYMYPQAEFPYDQLVAENAARGCGDPEFELLDTGIFDDGRYWEITADYAKAAPEDVLVRVSVRNAGPETATLDVLPTLWFRNTWSWGDDAPKPSLRLDGRRDRRRARRARHAHALGDRRARRRSSARTRRTPQRLCGHADRDAVPEGRHQRPRRPRRGRPSTRSRRARRPRSATASRSPPGETAGRSSCASRERPRPRRGLRRR